MLEITTDAVVSVNHSGNFTFINRRANELLTLKGDLSAKTSGMSSPQVAEPGEYLYHYNRAMYEGIPGDFEDFYPAPLNMWLSIQVRPSTGGVVIFFRDITARRQA